MAAAFVQRRAAAAVSRGRAVEEGAHGQLVQAGGLYARMWADYQKAVSWKIEKEVA